MPSFPIDTRDDADDVASDADDVASDAVDEEASRVFPMAWFHETLWVIYNIAAVAALLVTLTYWALLFRLVNNLRALTVVVHGVDSVLMIGDTILSSIPVRLLHVIYPMFYSITYIVFTVIYWAPGGGSALPYNRLLGMCRWMGSHFHHWTDYHGVAFSIELVQKGRYIFRVWGKTVLHIYS